MTGLEAALVLAMEKASPCGRSIWSTERVPVAECASSSESCRKSKKGKRDRKDPRLTRWSSFYGAWVEKQSAESCKAQRQTAARALVLELEGLPDPIHWAGLVIGVAANESGFREDVLVGRGRSGHIKPTDKQYDDAGGQGRGPANEACWMQIIPSMAKRYGGPEKLIGDNEEALRLCFRAGLDQLKWARKMCPASRRERVMPDGFRYEVSPLWATIARYGTGTSCTSDNDGKTSRRVETAEWMIAVIRREMKKGR